MLVYFLWLLGDTGSFDPFPQSAPRRCMSLDTGITIADAVADQVTGLVYLASAAEEGDGALYALDLRAAAPAPQRLTPQDLRDLRPGGLGFYRGPDGSRALFVIDRHPGAVRVKIFELTDDGAQWRETIADPAFRSLRAIAPVGPRQFYVAESSARFVYPFETLLRLPLSAILYFDGTLADPVATGLNTLRGLALSPDGATLYTAEAIPHRIRVYARDASGALRSTRNIALRAVPDRLTSDSAGRLWLAGQPRVFRRALHRLDARFDVPSLALRLDPARDSVDIVYAGQDIADARIVLPVADKLFLVARHETVVLICE
jgi:hypothetical protein